MTTELAQHHLTAELFDNEHDKAIMLTEPPRTAPPWQRFANVRLMAVKRSGNARCATTSWALTAAWDAFGQSGDGRVKDA